MFIGLRIAALILGVYGGFRLAGIGIRWMKHGIHKLEPPKDE